MTRHHFGFDCAGDWLVATLDDATGTTALLIVSGGNELRCGPHGSMAALAADIARAGHPVLRFDPPGVGESDGDNHGFRARGASIQAALDAFRLQSPHISRIVAMGNCDGAATLLLNDFGVDSLILCNPWTRDDLGTSSLIQDEISAPAMPSKAAIRQRYWARLKQPRRLLRDLLGGAIDVRKLAGGLAKLGQKSLPLGTVATAMAKRLAAAQKPVHFFIAERDSTALDFTASFQTQAFAAARANAHVMMHVCDTASHSFADPAARDWLRTRILALLHNT